MDFRETLIERYGFSESDLQETAARFLPGTLPARGLFLGKGQVADRMAYLRSGLMRSFMPVEMIPLVDTAV